MTKKKQGKKQAAPEALKDETLDQATGGSDYGVWRQNFGSTVPSAAGPGGGPHVKTFDGRSG